MVTSTVSVVDPEIMVEIKQIETGAMPHGSRISPDGLFQYSVAMMSGELFEVDAISLKVNRKLSLEKEMSHSHHHMHHDNDMKMVHSKVKPTWVIPHPSKKSVFVAGNGSDEIIEVDLDNWEVTNRINVGKGPYNIEISPDGKYLVSTLKGEGSTGVWSLEDISVNRIIKNTTMVSHGIAISPDSKYAFVSVEGIGGEPGKVDVINLENMSLLSSVNVGKQAGGIAFWKISD
jgi:DNA-binding beta-propeller fold protein YncE